MSIEAQLFELREYARRENISVKEIFNESKAQRVQAENNLPE